MSNFGQGTEAGEGSVRKLYTGVENFRVTAVCPDHQTLIKMYGSNAKEDTYVMTNDDGKSQVKIVLYLDNEAEEGEDSIKTRMTFFVTKDGKTSTTGKDLYINIYGQNAWLPQDGSIPDNMSWFDEEGMRKAFDGEDKVIDFLRNLLNLPSKDKADNPSDSHSQFSEADWNAMFSGNFASLNAAVMSSPNKIGVLLGVKTTDDGKMYQDVYNRGTLRQWSKSTGKFDYLRKNVQEAQAAGSFPKTDFGNPDYKLREFEESNVAASNTSAFNTQPDAAPKASFFETANAAVDDDAPF